MKSVKLIFLGGIGEIGKNMTAIEYGNDIIVVDGGLAFPTADMPGVDLVIPDYSYLTDNSEKLRGVIVTHGHEDHIGALPFVLKQLNLPVYGTKLTLALLEHKLREHEVKNYKLHNVNYGGRIKLGCFEIEFIKMSHSITGAVAFAIHTPVGIIFHTGDYKIDFTPIDGVKMDLSTIASIGNKNVLLMLGESTNVEREGYTMSERTVGEALDKIFATNISRRIIIATFASNVHRLQQILDLAQKYGRRAALSGRSMENVTEMAISLGELKIKEEFVPLHKINEIPDDKLIIICTGSQGEPMSALTRMGSGDSKIKINNNDTIVISSSPIPGNEKMVYDLINNLYRKGANVIYEAIADIHVSGHACREELKTMLSLVKPMYFIPVHGEYRHLKQHADLACAMGIPSANTFIPEVGDVLEVNRKGIKRVTRVKSGPVFVDGMSVGGETNVLRDRIHLSENGFLIVIITCSAKESVISEEPIIIFRGFKLSDELLEECKRVAFSTFNSNLDATPEDKKAAIRKALKKLILTKTKQFPMILPIILE